MSPARGFENMESVSVQVYVEAEYCPLQFVREYIVWADDTTNDLCRYAGETTVGPMFPFEVRLMPGDTIVSEGYTVLFNSLAPPVDPPLTSTIKDAGVVHGSLIVVRELPGRHTPSGWQTADGDLHGWRPSPF